MPGIPRVNYMPYPFQIVQSRRNILFVHEYASSNRVVNVGKPAEAPVDINVLHAGLPRRSFTNNPFKDLSGTSFCSETTS